MKKLFYILILFTTAVKAQLHKMQADTEYFYTYGGINFDEARDIKEAPDKGYILAGTTSSFGQGQTSFYLIKTDSLGNHIWSSVQGGSQNDWAYTVQLTYDSGFFVAGFSSSFDPTGNNSYNAYYLKTDKNGHLLWEKSVYATDFSFIYGSCALPDSGFILCGRTYASTHGGTDAYLIRVNKNGDTLWTHNYGGLQDEVFNSVCFINNRLYAVGSNNSNPTDTASDGWIVKLDMNGIKLQEAFISYGSHLQEVLNGVTPYSPNMLSVCGSTFHPDSSATTGILIKYDTSLVLSDLIINSAGNYSRGYFLQFNKVINISYGSICALGTRNGGSGGLGVFFLGIDQYGNTIYVPGTSFGDGFYPVDGGTANDKGYSGIFTTGGKVVTVGNTLSTQEYCTNINLAEEDIFLIRYNSDSIHFSGVIPKYHCFADTLGLSVAGISTHPTDNMVILYPNPVYGNTTLVITDNSSQRFTANVYTILGEEILHFTAESYKNNNLNLASLQAGSYFLKIINENGSLVSTIKFIVIK